MRVLLVGHTYIAPINRAKLRSLADLGVSLSAVVPSNWRSHGHLFEGQTFNIAPEEGDGVSLSAYPVVRPGHCASHWYSLRAVVRAIDSFQPDIVHIENEVYSVVAAEFAAVARTRRTLSTLFVWENLDRPVHPVQYVCRGVAMRQVAGIVCGNLQAEELVRHWGFSKPTMVLPQLGIDERVFFSSDGTEAPGPITIGFVGRLVWDKGCDILLRAVASLIESGLEVRCVLCGAGPDREALVQLAETLGISHAVRFPGEVSHEQVPEIMRQFPILVLPSRTSRKWSEQFGHVLIEAMSSGCVVVGASSGAIPEVIGRADMIFPENSVEHLVQIIRRVATDPHERSVLRTYFQNRVRERFTHAVIARQMLDFWERILSRGQSAN